MLKKEEIKYTYNDISIRPAVISSINHRKDCNPYLNGKLPIFASPMTTVIDEENADVFDENGIIPILPRNIDLDKRIEYSLNGRWCAFSQNEFADVWCNEKSPILIMDGQSALVLCDVANGQMKSLYELNKQAKKIYGDKITTMIGNVAHPNTYEMAAKSGVDYVRCSVGNGMGCATSSLTGVNYPIVSLISEMIDVREHIKLSNPYLKLPKIIADGGIRKFRDVVKALALGADYVMIGGMLGQLFESASPCKFHVKGDEFSISWKEMIESDSFSINENKYSYNGNEIHLYKIFYGMASKNGQNDISKTTNVEEGVTLMLPVRGNIKEWVRTMEHALKSAMSYCNCNDIKDFSEKADVVVISQNSYNCIND